MIFSPDSLDLFERLLANARFEVTADSVEAEARIISVARRELTEAKEESV